MKRILVDGIYLGMEMKGVGRYVANTLRQLDLLDQTNQYLVLVRAAETMPMLPQSERFSYIPVALQNHYWHGFFALPRYAHKLRADVAWIPYETPLGNFPCPYTVVCHDVPQLISISQRAAGERVSPVRNVIARADQFLIQRSLQHAHLVFANSHFVENWLHQTLRIPREKIAYAPCAPGADFAALAANVNRQAVLAELNCPNGYVLVFATGDRRENFETVLRVFEFLARETHVNFVIAGTRGNEGQDIRIQLERFDWKERVRVLPFLGENETQQLANVYASASVYLDLSLHEGFGMQVIEAMACGTPVVCSNRGALPEVAGDAAMLVDPENVDVIVSELKRMLADGVERTSWMEAGRAQSSKYSWGKTAHKISIYFANEPLLAQIALV